VRLGPGAGTYGVVIGLSLLSGAVLLGLDWAGWLGVELWPAWLGTSLAILGIAVVVAGLRGRRAGGLFWLALVGVLVGLATLSDDGEQWNWDRWDAWEENTPDTGGQITEGRHTPRTIDDAEDGFRVRFGNPTIDLTELDLTDVTPGDPAIVPISVSAGESRIVIPQDEPVEAEVRLVAGDVEWRVDDSQRSVSGIRRDPVQFETQEVDDEGGSRLLVLVDAGAGSVIIEEGS
jgi:Cell wall-active antibiotics response 4TMS YvqF